MEKGLTTVIVFENGEQIIIDNVYSCFKDLSGDLVLETLNDFYNTMIVTTKPVKTWVGVLDKSDLIYKDGKCIGWKKKMYFDEEKN